MCRCGRKFSRINAANIHNSFLTDTSADKRAKLVERLLSRPEFVDYWTYKWSDLFLVNSRKLNGTALTTPNASRSAAVAAQTTLPVFAGSTVSVKPSRARARLRRFTAE